MTLEADTDTLQGLMFVRRSAVRHLTDRLADERGGDYTDDPADAGYYGALDDMRQACSLPPCDRSKRDHQP